MALQRRKREREREKVREERERVKGEIERRQNADLRENSYGEDDHARG